MSLSHAILASLIGESPSSGYDLAKRFNATVGFFWKATHQQIYKELARLESEGLLESEVVVQEERPDKKIYSVTEEGKNLLLGWLAEPATPSPIKEELQVKMHVGYLLPKEIIIDELKRHRKLHRERLDLYNEREKRYFSDVEGLSSKGRFRYINLRSGIIFEKSRITWIDEAIKFLSEGRATK